MIYTIRTAKISYVLWRYFIPKTKYLEYIIIPVFGLNLKSGLGLYLIKFVTFANELKIMIIDMLLQTLHITKNVIYLYFIGIKQKQKNFDLSLTKYYDPVCVHEL